MPCGTLVYHKLGIDRLLQRQIPILEEKLPEQSVVFALLRCIDGKIKETNQPHIPRPPRFAHMTSNGSISSAESFRARASRQSFTYSEITEATRYEPSLYGIDRLNMSTSSRLSSFVKSPSMLSKTTLSTIGLNGSIRSQLRLNWLYSNRPRRDTHLCRPICKRRDSTRSSSAPPPTAHIPRIRSFLHGCYAMVTKCLFRSRIPPPGFLSRNARPGGRKGIPCLNCKNQRKPGPQRSRASKTEPMGPAMSPPWHPTTSPRP